ncbi:GNAT family N-acetyltransferase [Chloroflexota bacterium]
MQKENRSQDISVQNVGPDNLGVLLSLARHAADEGFSCLPGTVSDIKKRFRRPNISPDKHVLLANYRGKAIGFIEIIPEGVIKRAILNLWVTHGSRHIGAGRALVNAAARVCQEEELSLLHVFAPEKNNDLHRILGKMCFTARRRFIGILLDITNVKETQQVKDGLSVTPLKKGQEGLLAEIQNAAFAGSWGYNPNTPQTIEHSLSFRHCSTDDVRIVVNESGEALAYCWVIIPPSHEQPKGAMFGRVSMMGVLPAERGKGMARRALEAGIEYLRCKGVSYIELTVDADNMPARRLYQRAGFVEDHATICFEKTLLCKTSTQH